MLDLGNILAAGGVSPLSVFGVIFTQGGIVTLLAWAIIVIMAFFGARSLWLGWRRNLYAAKQEFILLAIDIPKEHDQSPKIVEQMFAQMWGLIGGANFVEKWWKGKTQLPYSMEIVSIEGYIQFLVHLPAPFRDLVEAAIYAQYPAADVVEVEDYTKYVPKSWPTEGWDLWGSEFKLAQSDAYPIKTYPFFEHQLTQKFTDPLAALLEIMSSAGPGEQIWLQWVITPIKDDWHKNSQNEVKSILGQKISKPKGKIAKLFLPLIAIFGALGDFISAGFGAEGNIFAGSESVGEAVALSSLTPGETEVIKAIQAKAGKIGYRVKMRLIYVGLKDNFNKAKSVAGMIGALRQYSELSLNSFVPAGVTATKADYVRVPQRIAKKQNKILRAFKGRSQGSGAGSGFILNVEELATLWHFPSGEVQAPRVKRAEARTAEPPVSLPTEEMFGQPVEARSSISSDRELQPSISPEPEPQDSVPSNLPI